MRWFVAAIAACLLAPGIAHADQAPSVLVRTEMPHQGTLPDIVSTYGTAMPALNGGMTLSVQQDGRVTAIEVTPGEKVRAGQHLLEFSASAAASSAFQQAVTALSLARAQRDHTAQLLRQQLATRDQLAQAEKTVADAQAALDALRREGGGEPVRNLDAPFDGIIEAIPIAQGDRVQPGAPLVTLVRLDGLVVTVGIEPANQSRVRPGQPVHLVPLASGEPVDGHVLRVDAILNPKTRMVDADIAVPVGAVIPGMAFLTDITVGQFQGWVVPHDTVLIDDHGPYVFQVNGAKAVRVDVTLSGTNGSTDVVRGPVNPGLPVVVAGNYQLQDGMAVREPTAKEAAR